MQEIQDSNKAMVVAGKARFSALSQGLVRMEFSPDGIFEDRRSLRALTRPEPIAFRSIREADGWVFLETETMVFQYAAGKEFSEATLLAAHRDSGEVFWRYGRVDTENLGGVHLSMDCINREVIPRGVHPATSEAYPNGVEHMLWHFRAHLHGTGGGITEQNYTGMSLPDVVGTLPPEERSPGFAELLSQRAKYPPGLLSRAGYFLLNDSVGAVMDPASGWLAPRRTGQDARDLYLFRYGRDYCQALRDYVLAFGNAPLIPRYSLGSWYSRYPTYDEPGLRELIAEYDRHDLPLDVLVLDLEWHQRGWFGFDWDTKHIHDPDGFLAFLKAQRIHTTFNIHPAAVPEEDTRYPEFIARAGIKVREGDVSKRKGARVFAKFDTGNKRHADAFMDVLHKPVQDQGVDFWWIDGYCPVDPRHGVDAQLWTNHVYQSHMENHYADRRPLVFTRTAGFGSHRYPFHFTGDTSANGRCW